MNSLSTEQLGIGYGDRVIVEDLNISIPKGKITTLIRRTAAGNQRF